MIGAVGDDLFGELMLSRLMGEGIDTVSVRMRHGDDRDRPHPGRHRHRAERHRDRAERQPLSCTEDDVEEALRALAGRVSVVLVQLEIPLPVVTGHRERVPRARPELILDPAPAQPLPDDLWSGISVDHPQRDSRPRP